MKQTLISRLIVGALATVAAGSAFAGQIQSSSVSIAREVITSNDQKVVSPAISYRFFGDVDARNQDQTFQVQFKLPAGVEWKTTGLAIAAGVAPQIRVTDGVAGGAAVAQGTAAGQIEVVALNIDSTDKSIIYATLTLHQGAAALVKQPLITLSSSGTASDNPTIVGLKNIVGTVGECDTEVKKLPVNFKHFVSLSTPTTLATEANAQADEHVRSGSTNDTTLITFPVNIKVAVTAPTRQAQLDPALNQTVFKNNGVATATPPGFGSWVSNTLANLGSINLTQNAFGYDADGKVQYLLANMSAIAAATAPYTTPADSGDVEAKQLEVTVNASAGFVVNTGSQLFLSNAANCGAAIAGTAVAITSSNAAGPIKLTLPTAGLDAAAKYVCYDTGTTAGVIPASSFDATAVLVKADNNAAFDGEQNNSCKGPLTSLGGQIKIDVRNYAANARQDGWLSVLRLINNSESRTIDVYGQYIHADGMYGKWGKVATLKPRAVVNMLPADVDGKLTSAPAHSTSANNATAALPTSGDAPRLRLTTDNGNTLRVQNYLYNPASGNFIEASSSQGVDLSGNVNDRAQGVDTLNDQDAQVGLNGQN
ncbi:hypothetical protein [Chitinilyticum aquatile]|uniref:hypothetical protein n=1 Tax=Chitinilyticum aquatile TaxID=362520 RepID=UPI000414DF9A|nr:hypothetical protein [Chitinilyticum aquatile]